MVQLPKYKYYRITFNNEKINGNSELAIKLRSITKYSPNYYNKPVIKEGGNIVEIISDEAEFKEHYCVSLIITPFLEKKFKQSIEEKLENLISVYGLDDIHFTDIFNRKSKIRDKRNEFLQKYAEIISGIKNMCCLSISKNKIELLNEMDTEEITDEELFHTLFWNLFERVIIPFRDHSIFHIWFEQEYSLSIKSMNRIAKRLIGKLNSGIDHINNKYPEKYISILKYPLFFSKKALLYSSLSDLVAYVSNKIQHKIDSGIPIKKIQKEYSILLKLVKNIFINYSGLSSKDIINLIDNTN